MFGNRNNLSVRTYEMSMGYLFLLISFLYLETRDAIRDINRVNPMIILTLSQATLLAGWSLDPIKSRIW